MNFLDTIIFLGQIDYEEFKKHDPEITGNGNREIITLQV